MKKTGVGVIGASVDRGWSARAHIPAILSMPEVFSLNAVSTTRQETADAAAAHYGVPGAYADNSSLVSDPSVDLVIVAVKVPAHFDAVMQAIKAGKHVYCEWPLGRTLEEAIEMQAAAQSAGVRTFVGLQAQRAPWVRYARALIEQGFIGRVLSTSIIGSGRSWGPTVAGPSAYLLDRTNGATMLTIPFGHFLDALCFVLGEVEEVSALLTHGRTSVTLVETGETVPMSTHDQIAVAGRLETGATLSAHYRGGLSRATNFLWEINGEDGDLIIEASAGQIQMVDLRLKGARGQDVLEVMEPPAEFMQDSGGLDEMSANVARFYAQLARDLAENTTVLPDFRHAVQRHRTLAAIEAASESGQRQPANLD